MKRLLSAFALLATPAMAQMTTTNQATSAVAGSLSLPGPAYLHGINVTSGASAGYVMLFDAAAVPADGTVTPARCLPLAANTGIERTFPTPLRIANGITVVFSTTGCFTKTVSATAFIAVDFR